MKQWKKISKINCLSLDSSITICVFVFVFQFGFVFLGFEKFYPKRAKRNNEKGTFLAVLYLWKYIFSK